MNARHSAETPEWYTPSPYVEAARAVMGSIDLDPASCAEANETVKATTFFSEADNGLEQAWHGRIFLNPPGGLVKQFWYKLLAEFYFGGVSEAIWIGYSLEQLQTLQDADGFRSPIAHPICIPKRRIPFIENEAKRITRIEKRHAENAARVLRFEKPRRVSEKADSPSHGNYITYLGHNADAFAYVFQPFGQVRLDHRAAA